MKSINKNDIDVSKLIFSKGEYDGYISKMTVVHFWADRCGPGTPFIVLDHNEKYMEAIFPRIRINEKGEICLGQDATIKRKSNNCTGASDNCTCTNEYLSVNTCENCKNDIIVERRESFDENVDNECQIVRAKYDHNLLDFTTKKEINELDESDSDYMSYVIMSARKYLPLTKRKYNSA